MLGKIEGTRRRGRDKGWVDDITDSMDMSLNKLREGDSEGQGSLLQSMGSQRVGQD